MADKNTVLNDIMPLIQNVHTVCYPKWQTKLALVKMSAMNFNMYYNRKIIKEAECMKCTYGDHFKIPLDIV